MSPFYIALNVIFGPLPLAFGIRLPSPSFLIPGLMLQAGSFSLEAFYEHDDVKVMLPGRVTFYWAQLVGGWCRESR